MPRPASPAAPMQPCRPGAPRPGAARVGGGEQPHARARAFTLKVVGANSQDREGSRAGTLTPRGMNTSPLCTAICFRGRWMPSKMLPSRPGPSSTDRGCRARGSRGARAPHACGGRGGGAPCCNHALVWQQPNLGVLGCVQVVHMAPGIIKGGVPLRHSALCRAPLCHAHASNAARALLLRRRMERHPPPPVSAAALLACSTLCPPVHC